jgi:hypothetical protein
LSTVSPISLILCFFVLICRNHSVFLAQDMVQTVHVYFLGEIGEIFVDIYLYYINIYFS